MVIKAQTLKPDVVLKNYWRDNGQFSDLFNAILFHGEPIIKPEELEEADTEESSVTEHRETVESIQAARDNVKIQKRDSISGVQLVLLGLEHQEYTHFAMPMRVMGYDYGAYKKQYDRNARQYKKAKGLDEDEFLSRMRKDDKFLPVITVVLYYGEKPWRGATSLHEMLRIPKVMCSYVNDYKIILVEARDSRLCLHNSNNVDLFRLLEILLDKGRTAEDTEEKAVSYVREHKVDKSVIMTAAGAANCKIDYNRLAEKGEFDMCTVFEQIRLESEKIGEERGKKAGEEQGRIRGIIELGFELGLSEEEILTSLQTRVQISEQEALEYLKVFGKQTAS